MRLIGGRVRGRHYRHLHGVLGAVAVLPNVSPMRRLDQLIQVDAQGTQCVDAETSRKRPRCSSKVQQPPQRTELTSHDPHQLPHLRK
jgi:hypothetical protein